MRQRLHAAGRWCISGLVSDDATPEIADHAGRDERASADDDAAEKPDADTPKRGFFRRFVMRFPSWEERKQTLRVEAWLVCVFAVAQYAFAMAFPHNYRDENVAHVALAWAAFLAETFLYHTGLLVVVVALIAGWRRRWALFGVSLPVAAVIVGPVWWSALPGAANPVAGRTVRVMSANVLMINTETDAMLEEIRREDPDVVLIQEYSGHWHEAFQRELLPEYPHFAGIHQQDSFGAAIYSRIPFAEPATTQMTLAGMKMPQIRAVFEIDGRRVAFYNFHIVPPRNLGYSGWHRRQFADLLNIIDNDPRPKLIAGDFNFTGSSPMARDLRAAGYIDTHDLAGVGTDTTWPVKGIFRYLPVPGLRIDHVYLSPQLTATSHHTGIGQGSDHRPIITTVGFRASAKKN